MIQNQKPFGEIDLLDPLKIRWWQIVTVVEAGRMAPSWDLGTLHSDMKYDYKIGLRGMFYTNVVRLSVNPSKQCHWVKAEQQIRGRGPDYLLQRF